MKWSSNSKEINYKWNKNLGKRAWANKRKDENKKEKMQNLPAGQSVKTSELVDQWNIQTIWIEKKKIKTWTVNSLNLTWISLTQPYMLSLSVWMNQNEKVLSIYRR